MRTPILEEHRGKESREGERERERERNGNGESLSFHSSQDGEIIVDVPADT